jgi:hypothetical protein
MALGVSALTVGAAGAAPSTATPAPASQDGATDEGRVVVVSLPTLRW